MLARVRAKHLIDWLRQTSLSAVIVLGEGKRALQAATAMERRTGGRIIVVARNPDAFKDLDEPGELECHWTKSLSVSFVRNLLSEDSLRRSMIVSVGSPWIVKKEVLDLVQGRAMNLHPGSLPMNRGASATSWALMNQEPNPRVTIHVMGVGIDTGDLILEQEILSGTTASTPSHFSLLADGASERLLSRFFDLISYSDQELPDTSDHVSSRYFPPLSADRNGWIDWNWHGSDILAFIQAFSEPYNGASNLFQGQRVRVFAARFVEEDVALHPFTAGLVVGMSKDEYRIAVHGGELHVNKYQVVGPSLNEIREGDRLHTPQSLLDDAKMFRRRNL